MSPIAIEPAIVPDVARKIEQPTKPAQETRGRHEEYQYLDLIRDILENGEHRPDR